MIRATVKNYLTLLSHGSKIGGAAVGGAVGALAGPAGAVAGAAIGAAVGEVCIVVMDDIANRFLSPREEQRVAGVAALAIDAIRDRLQWEKIRDDDFFERGGESPSPAEELFEGVLLSAKQEHEERKLPYLANFYSNLPFRQDVSRSEANHVLALAENLTYEQFKILALMNQPDKFPIRRDQWKDVNAISDHSRSLAQQMLYLHERHLVTIYEDDGELSSGIYDIDLVPPGSASLSLSGKRFVDLLDLDKIERCEITELAKHL